jgi:hypothetical protein
MYICGIQGEVAKVPASKTPDNSGVLFLLTPLQASVNNVLFLIVQRRTDENITHGAAG